MLRWTLPSQRVHYAPTCEDGTDHVESDNCTEVARVFVCFFEATDFLLPFLFAANSVAILGLNFPWFSTRTFASSDGSLLGHILPLDQVTPVVLLGKALATDSNDTSSWRRILQTVRYVIIERPYVRLSRRTVVLNPTNFLINHSCVWGHLYMWWGTAAVKPFFITSLCLVVAVMAECWNFKTKAKKYVCYVVFVLCCNYNQIFGYTPPPFSLFYPKICLCIFSFNLSPLHLFVVWRRQPFYRCPTWK